MSSYTVAHRFLNYEDLRQRLLVDWGFATQGLFWLEMNGHTIMLFLLPN